METLLIYLGPSLPRIKAQEIFFDAGHDIAVFFRPPARQADIVTDLMTYHPTRLFLIDGVFRENLSVWQKELVYALQFPGLKAIYGAASMGALRAAELDYLGMTGVGKIYEWYRDGVTEDESEVAVSYATREGPDGPRYYVNSVPLVDIRAGVKQHPDPSPAREFLARDGPSLLHGSDAGVM